MDNFWPKLFKNVNIDFESNVLIQKQVKSQLPSWLYHPYNFSTKCVVICKIYTDVHVGGI